MKGFVVFNAYLKLFLLLSSHLPVVVNISCPSTKLILVDKVIGSSNVIWDLPLLTVGGEHVAVIIQQEADNGFEIIESTGYTPMKSESEATDILLDNDQLIPVTTSARGRPIVRETDARDVESTRNPFTEKFDPVESELSSLDFSETFTKSKPSLDILNEVKEKKDHISSHFEDEEDIVTSSGLGPVNIRESDPFDVEATKVSEFYYPYVTSVTIGYETEVVTEYVTLASDDMYTYSGWSGETSTTPDELMTFTTTNPTTDDHEGHPITTMRSPDDDVITFLPCDGSCDGSGDYHVESASIEEMFEEDGRIEVIASHNPGDMFIVGVTTVSYSVLEIAPSKFLTNCSFDVEVIGKFITLCILLKESPTCRSK